METIFYIIYLCGVIVFPFILIITLRVAIKRFNLSEDYTNASRVFFAGVSLLWFVSIPILYFWVMTEWYKYEAKKSIENKKIL